MAQFDAPQTAYVKTNSGWKQVDLIDAGASQIKVGGSWKNITELWVKVNVGGVATWKQVLTATNPNAPTLLTRKFTNTSFEMTWTNPSGVQKYEIKRRLQSADANDENNYTTIVTATSTISTSLTDAVSAGSVGDGKYNAVNGSTTNVQGPRYVYRLRVWDAFGHMAQLEVDTLRGRVVSPLYIRATNSRTFRGSDFRTGIGNRAYQGYTTNGMNYGHYWYGGTGNGIVNNCFGDVLLPTCSAAEFMACRDAGGIGDGGGTAILTMWTHNQLDLVAATNGWSNNGTNIDGTGQNRETQVWQSIGTTNGTNLITGTSAKGIATYNSDTVVQSFGTSRHYFIAYGYDEPRDGASAGNGTSTGEWPGMLKITHSG